MDANSFAVVTLNHLSHSPPWHLDGVLPQVFDVVDAFGGRGEVSNAARLGAKYVSTHAGMVKEYKLKRMQHDIHAWYNVG